MMIRIAAHFPERRHPMYTLKDIAEQSSSLSPELYSVWVNTILPVAGHYRLDHFSFRTLEDFRQRLSRRGISYREFRAAILPCLESLFAVCPDHAHPDTAFFSRIYPEIILPFEDWAIKWQQTLEETFALSTATRYSRILTHNLIPALGKEDLTLWDKARMDKLKSALQCDEEKKSYWRQISGVLYSVLDYGIAHAALKADVVSFRTAALDWLEDAPRSFASNTFATYQSIVSKYMLPLLGDRPLFAFDNQLVANYRRRVLAMGLSDGRFAIHWTVLTAILRHAAERGWISSAPDLHIPYPKRKDSIQFPDAQSMESALQSDHSWPASFIVCLAWDMGLTREEIRDFTWEVIDPTSNTAVIDGRTVTIPDHLLPAFDAARRKTGGIGNVVRSTRGKLLTSENISMNARKFLSAHGMEHIRLADLRHGYILRTINQVCVEEAARRCGYKSPEILLRLYGKYLKKS